MLERPTGMYGRQATIGLDVPQWVYVALTLPRNWSHDSVRSAIELILPSIATLGVEGASFVVPARLADPTAMESLKDSVSRVLFEARKRRPWFSASLGNEEFYRQNASRVGASTGIFLVMGPEPRVIEASEVPKLHDRGQHWVVCDVANGLVGVGSDPATMSRIAHKHMTAKRIAARPSDHVDAAVRRQMTVLLAMNALVKPSKFPAGSFLATNDYTNTMVAECINRLGLKPKLTPDPEAPVAAAEFAISPDAFEPAVQP